MMTDQEGAQPPRQLGRELMEELMFGTGRVHRFTLDSPVLPDVWLEYAKGSLDDFNGLTVPTEQDDPFPPVKLLLTPFRESFTGDIRRELRERLLEERSTMAWQAFGHNPKEPPRVVYIQSTVAATLYFEELIRGVLPMTDWWARLARQWYIDSMSTELGEEFLAHAVQDPEHPPLFPAVEKGEALHPPPAFLWMIRVLGALALFHRRMPLPMIFYERDGTARAGYDDWKVLVRAATDLIQNVRSGSDGTRVDVVSLRREATHAVSRSTQAIKADAARRLFEISCRELVWAVVDGGIDARHPAFRQRNEWGECSPQPFINTHGEPDNCTRIVETYDFTHIEHILDPDSRSLPIQLGRRITADRDLAKKFRALKRSLAAGGSVDWRLLAPLLRIPHDPEKYIPPLSDHGTHVAGILASNWRSRESGGMLEEDLIGVCPDLRLFDLRVMNPDGRGDEFAVMAALQFIRHLNSANDFMVVHGINLSMSIPFDVVNYACGRTPICEECERVVNSGVVVVAAAGNQGYVIIRGHETFQSIGITDPGNTDLVITVGATHRYRPHTYGISYFSSRGPTADGRLKPDLLAPGERITAPTPNGMFGSKDGTSMAAPHVSGAAALLMARNNELVGRPARIKQILCSTATDLGRERYFQGAGMLDVLRALQSI
jgi:serine protease AprX